jgi:hypothetical protein
MRSDTLEADMYNVLEKVPDTVLPAPATETRSPPAVRWRLGTRIAFRFCAAYFTLYILATQMIGSLLSLPPLSAFPPLRTLTTWVATGLWGFGAPLVIQSGSGDKPFDWALSASLLAIASAVTAVWSLLDRARPGYVGLCAWFHVFLRLSVGATMISYGMAKAIPLQMPFPGLSRLVEPYGHFSLMGVLWAQVGASPAFERFTGSVELSAGILLLLPGLTLLGAVVSLLASTFVFVLNMTYDVPVKLFSLHLVVMSLLLLAPERKRLLNVFLLNRAAAPRTETPLVRRPLARKVVVGLQLALGVWLVYSNFTGSVQARARFGSAAPKPPLYGIWDIETMAIDGHVRAPLTTDYGRWRRVVISTSTALSFQRMDDTFVPYRAAFDAAAGTVTLSRAAPPGTPPASAPSGEVGRLAFKQTSPEQLILEGAVDGRQTRMELRRVDLTSFRLLQSRFRWVQDYPFNR